MKNDWAGFAPRQFFWSKTVEVINGRSTKFEMLLNLNEVINEIVRIKNTQAEAYVKEFLDIDKNLSVGVCSLLWNKRIR